MGEKLRCLLCQDVIESLARYDFVECKCGSVAIDGGSLYTRIATRDADTKFEMVTGNG